MVKVNIYTILKMNACLLMNAFLFASINDLLRDTDSEEEAEEKDVKNRK